MEYAQNFRGSGAASILSGFLLIAWVAAYAYGTDVFVPVVPAAILLLILAVPGMHGAQEGQNGAAGRFGFFVIMLAGVILLVLIGMAIYAELVLGEPAEEAFPQFLGLVFLGSFFGLVIGLLIFGVAGVAAGVISRLGWFLLLIALPLGLILDWVTGGFEAEDELTVGFAVGPPLFGVALILIGYALWANRRRLPSEAAPAAVAPAAVAPAAVARPITSGVTTPEMIEPEPAPPPEGTPPPRTTEPD